jgi:hypothetical protein
MAHAVRRRTAWGELRTSVLGQWFTSGVLLALGSQVVWVGVLAVDSEV